MWVYNIIDMPSGVADQLDRFLPGFRLARGSADPVTHTLIPSGPKARDGGSFHVPIAKEHDLINKHFARVTRGSRAAHLTEAQLTDGPILVDVDLHYAAGTTERQHNTQDIEKLIRSYSTAIAKYVTVDDLPPIDLFIMHKKDVNALEKKTKDGIHLIFGVNVKRQVQLAIRKDVVKELCAGKLLSGLQTINRWEDVIDVAITRGTTNWQAYGSCKPGHQPYEVTQHYRLYPSEQLLDKVKLIADARSFKHDNYKRMLSARFRDYPTGDTKDEFAHLLVDKKHSSPLAQVGSDIILSGISNEEDLDKAIEYQIFGSSHIAEYRVTETHQFAMALPESYYGPGSYDRWMRCGWALANTSPKMFVTWLKMSCRDTCRATLAGPDGKFDWNNVAMMWDLWVGFDFATAEAEGLSYRSIMFWCKNDSIDEFDKIKKTTIDYFIDETLDPGRHVKKQFNALSFENGGKITLPKSTHTEFDVAQVLYQLFKDQFVCASIKNSIWYEFRQSRWHEIDSGSTLRLAISKHLYTEYLSRVIALMKRQTQLHEEGDDETESSELQYIKWKICRLTEVLPTLKKTVWKNNIMREAKEIFYNKDFYKNLDQNPYLLCFKNGVIDFKTKCFRQGLPEDYISFCTNIDYYPEGGTKRAPELEKELNNFMDQLFPDDNLRRYMWEHLASALIGTLENQTFNMYVGTGRNGKSVMVDLMSKVLGDYKGTVPTSLITQSRPSIGSTSSEIAQLRGVRYAVMQEPSKGDKINEGILKEITGGDPIQGRALFKDTITYTPQFNLVVCTNTLFEIRSNDDGTWRRIRKCDFESKFMQEPYKDPLFPKERCPFQFLLDKKLDQKFPEWAPVFAYMLVDVAFRTQGNVRDCDIVLSASMKYRGEQDTIANFVRENIFVAPGDAKLNLAEVKEVWKTWCKDTGIAKEDQPKQKEVVEYMTAVYGPPKGRPMGWMGLSRDNEEEKRHLNGCDEELTNSTD